VRYLNITIKKYDRFLLGAIVLLCIVGTVMLFSASISLSLEQTQGQRDTVYLQAHLRRLLIGFLAMGFFLLLDYRYLKRIAPYALIGTIVILILTKGILLLKGQSFPARWLFVGPFSIQTSDIARLALIIYLASYLDRKRDAIKNFTEGFLPPVFVIGLVVALIVIQPDFSTAAVMALLGFTMLYIGGARFPHLLATATTSLLVMVPVMLLKPYRITRILSYFRPDSVSAEDLYQIKQSLISIGNGGLFGLGLGNSLGKDLFLPTPHTDFIFAIIGEETGFIGAMLVITLFLFIFQRGIKIAKDCTDPFGVLLAIGIVFSFVSYAFINAAVVTSLLPTTGLPMPFISYGGSGLVINMVSMGILLNISQSKRSIARPPWRQRQYD